MSLQAAPLLACAWLVTSAFWPARPNTPPNNPVKRTFRTPALVFLLRLARQVRLPPPLNLRERPIFGTPTVSCGSNSDLRNLTPSV
jgi:hypothetical protein